MKHLSFPRPFAESYGVNLAIAILAIAPFIVVTTASELFRHDVASALNAGPEGLGLIPGLAVAGYAFGAMIGGDLILRIPQRIMFLACQSLLCVGCLLAAIAPGIVMYGAGLVLFGLATGLLLVSALPPVIRQFPASRMPTTAAVVNLGFFGAVAAGPLLGGAVEAGAAWRWFYGGLAALGVLNLGTALFTLRDQKPLNPGMPLDRSAYLLAFGSTFLPFLGTGALSARGFASYLFMLPIAVGLACFVALLLVEYHKKEPLSPVKPMWHTYPLVGTLAAMFGGAAFVSFLNLFERYLLEVAHRSPLEAGLTFWPQVVGVLITAALLGVVVRTRFLPVLTLAGMVLILAGGGLLLLLGPGHALELGAAALLGLGAGASVSPGLWMAGFSLPSRMVGRTFALVELVRSVADFLVAPVMVRIARISSEGGTFTYGGVSVGVWITIAITALMTLAGVALYLTGAGFNLPKPDFEVWLHKDGTAIQSPALWTAVRERKERRANRA